MLNVNELTSRMSKMSDDQLRQYARLHKDDPYTLALASSESKRRAQLRAGGQQQAAQQPTVAEQALAQMGAPAPMPQPQLPEQQGIGMLPAQNVEGMADGGIAGYGDSYADEYASGGIVAFAGEGPSLVGQGFRRDQMLPAPRANNFNQAVATRMGEAASQDTADEIARLENILATTPFEPQRQFAEKRLAQLRNKPITAPSVSETYPDETARGIRPKADVAQVSDKPAPFIDASKKRVAGAKQPGAGTTTGPIAEKAPDFVPSKPGDLATELKRLQAMNPGTKAYDDLNAKIKQGFADLEKAREESKPKGKAYEGLEALLGKEEEKAKGREARNLNMAIVNAGLAIAGGESQYALQNIAKGAQVGTKQYQEGLDKLEAAALERRKQAAMIEEARRAEARGDWKEAQQFKQKAFEAELSVNQAQIAAIQDLYKTDVKTAADIVNNQNTLAAADQRAMFEQQQQTIRAREQNISAEKIADKYASSRLGGLGARGQITPALALREYNDLISANPLAKKQYPTFESYMTAIQQASLGGKDPYAGWGNLQITNPKK
jgi:hypothetical protein